LQPALFVSLGGRGYSFVIQLYMGLIFYQQGLVLMNINFIVDFFDLHADRWDADMIRNDDVIDFILDNAGIRSGVSVLDVACGTGVLVPDYLARGVSSVTCVDISPKMIAYARQKFSEFDVRFICANVETATFTEQFDCIVVYNAFPHFFDPAKLVNKLVGDLKPGGVLTIAHGMSRADINKRHEESASTVSIDLMHEDELETLFRPYLTVTKKIADDKMFQVVGVKR
jgi:2-polyprenyl-3-methyl-5-hydroxy-6-metoxy-1,4-benzoquinol methylase